MSNKTKITYGKTKITYGEAAALCEDCFVSKKKGTIIDVIFPPTGKTLINGNSLDEVRKEYPDAEKMSVDEFCAWKSSQQRTPISWSETTEAEYWDMLGVLPPAIYEKGGFMVGEAYDHDAITNQPRYSAYRKRGEVFERASRPLTIAEYKDQTNG